MYWLKEFHFDGIRMDAISNMIYWQGNQNRGINDGAVGFLKNLNAGIKEGFPDVMLIAEDSTAFPKVTRPVCEGGLGFDYKWDMGWMNDTLHYFQGSSSDRIREYHKLTFSMAYFYDEKFLLPFSHDEVVRGKATILQKMNGSLEQKFPQARALYMYMFAHPGRKLNFMGNELGQLREWDENRGQDWNLLEFSSHEKFHHFMKDLNHFYLNHPAMYQQDYQRDGFLWTDCTNQYPAVYSFLRLSKEETSSIKAGTSPEYQNSMHDNCSQTDFLSSQKNSKKQTGSQNKVQSGNDFDPGQRREVILCVFNFSDQSCDYQVRLPEDLLESFTGCSDQPNHSQKDQADSFGDHQKDSLAMDSVDSLRLQAVLVFDSNDEEYGGTAAHSRKPADQILTGVKAETETAEEAETAEESGKEDCVQEKAEAGPDHPIPCNVKDQDNCTSEGKAGCRRVMQTEPDEPKAPNESNAPDQEDVLSVFDHAALAASGLAKVRQNYRAIADEDLIAAEADKANLVKDHENNRVIVEELMAAKTNDTDSDQNDGIEIRDGLIRLEIPPFSARYYLIQNG